MGGVVYHDGQFDDSRMAVTLALSAQDAGALGEFLYAAAAYACAIGADGEQALLDYAKQRQRVYTAFEALVRADNRDVNALTPAERQAYTEAAERAARA